MSPLIKIGGPVALIAALGYYYYTGFEDLSPSVANQLHSLPVVVPPTPTQRAVSNTDIVMEDRQSLVIYANELKQLYNESYFKKIQMSREAELDAKIAASMQKVREAGYTVDGGSFTLAQSNVQSALSSGVTETKNLDSQASSGKLDNSYYDAHNALAAMRLVMTQGDTGTFDLGGEFVNLSKGDSLGLIQVDDVDTKSGRATISSPRHGLRRTLMISQNQYVRPSAVPSGKEAKPKHDNTNNGQTENLIESTAKEYMHPIGSLFMNTFGGGGS